MPAPTPAGTPAPIARPPWAAVTVAEPPPIEQPIWAAPVEAPAPAVPKTESALLIRHRRIAPALRRFPSTARRFSATAWHFLRTLHRRPLSAEARGGLRVGALIAVCLGFALILIAGQAMTLRFFGTETQGKVRRNSVETLQVLHGGSGGTTYTYVKARYIDYVYQAANGATFVSTFSLDESVAGPAVGSSVLVHYRGSRPSDSYLVGIDPPSLLQLLKIPLGLLLLALGGWMFRMPLVAPGKEAAPESPEPPSA